MADAKHLEPHLGSTQVFHTWSNAQLKKEPIRIQVRDAVLAMLIRLHGEDPASYGFKLLQPDEKTIYKPYSLGFLEDADRDSALANGKLRSPRRAKQDAQETAKKSCKRETAAKPTQRIVNRGNCRLCRHSLQSRRARIIPSSNIAHLSSPVLREPLVFGTLCGLASAIGYTAAKLA